jgi:hypothetical protein
MVKNGNILTIPSPFLQSVQQIFGNVFQLKNNVATKTKRFNF